MIGLLEGIFIAKTRHGIILKTGGVGYLVNIPEALINKTKINSPLILHVYTNVTDDAITLFGFESEAELNLFELLLMVSGIGPRTGLNIINFGLHQVELAIINADVDFFTQIPRLGRKNAQKIIIELKSKLGSIHDLDLSDETNSHSDLITALSSMGFDKKEITTAVKKLPSELISLEQQLRHTLKLLQKNKI